MAHGAKGAGEAVKGAGLFDWLWRINALGLAIVLFVLIPLVIINSVFWDPFGRFETPISEPYALDAVPPELRFEGEEITTANGTVIGYKLEGEPEAGAYESSPNISLTDMQTGTSITILPSGSEQMILNWQTVGPLADGLGDPTAYVAFAGTKADIGEGYLDLILGDLRDLRQTTLRKRVRFVDGVRMLDADTVSMVVWTKLDEARFWIVDLNSFAIALDREVALPAVVPKDQEPVGLPQ